METKTTSGSTTIGTGTYIVIWITFILVIILFVLLIISFFGFFPSVSSRIVADIQGVNFEYLNTLSASATTVQMPTDRNYIYMANPTVAQTVKFQPNNINISGRTVAIKNSSSTNTIALAINDTSTPNVVINTSVSTGGNTIPPRTFAWFVSDPNDSQGRQVWTRLL